MGLVVHNLSWKLETPEKFFKLQCLGPIARASDLVVLGSVQVGGVYHASRLRTTAAGRQEGTISVQLGNFTDRHSLSEVPGWGLALTPMWGGRLAVGVLLRDCFRGGSDAKASACNAGDLGWEDPLEKEMATHSSTLAWKIPWIVETGRLQSLG